MSCTKNKLIYWYHFHQIPPKPGFWKHFSIFPRKIANRAATVSPIPHTALLHDLTTPLSTEKVWFPSPSIWTSVMRSLHLMECGRRTAWVPSMSEKAKHPPRGSLGMLVPREASCHRRSPTTLRAPHEGGHMWAVETKPAVQPSSHLHQVKPSWTRHTKLSAESPQSMLRGAEGSWSLLKLFLTHRIHEITIRWWLF